LGGFAAQAVLRAWLDGNAWYVPMMPMSSAAFIIFTLYMVPDPATTPLGKWSQVVFGLSVAFIYGYLQIMHVVYGLFIALAIICAIRGASIAFYTSFLQHRQQSAATTAPAGALATAGT
jgi:Na+-translocating ferredoxin:NAD+ oxidoreductase RnfD subunit